jgi:tetratricopeptide (TPR) repeat protein
LALVLTDLGRIALRREHYGQAEEYAEKGWDVASEIGHSEALAAIGQIRSRIAMERGDFDAAATHLRDSLERSEKIGHRWYESYLLIETGKLHLRRGRAAEAADAFRSAADIAHHIQSRDLEAQAIFGRAQVAALADGGQRAATDDAVSSLHILEEIGHYRAAVVRAWLSAHLVERGETLLRRLAFDEALEHFQQALAVAPAECDTRAFAAVRWSETIERRVQAGRRDTPPPPNQDRNADPTRPRPAPGGHTPTSHDEDGSANDPDGAAPHPRPIRQKS